MEFITFDDLEHEVQPGWRIENIIPESSFTLLYAERGVGKSFLALDWALCTLVGKPWCDREVKLGQVLYVIAEGGGGHMWRRVEAWKSYHAYSHGVGGRVVKHAIQFHRPLNVNALIQHIEDTNEIINLIVIDTVHRCFEGGDEDKAQDVGTWIAGINRVQNATDADILAIHHAGWTAVHERGSTALGAAADTILRLRATGDHLTLSCDKQKDAEEFADIPLRLVQHENSCVIIPASASSPHQHTLDTLVRLGGNATRDVWLKATNVSQATWYRHVEQLRKEGKISRDGDLYQTL